jgi:ABC-type maltose transport system permease subunit
MESDHATTPTDNSILTNNDLSKPSDQEKHKEVRKKRPRLIAGICNRQWLLLATCVLVNLAILGAAIAFARVNLEFRQYVFYPILVFLIGSGILAVTSLVIAKSINKPKTPKEKESDE